MCQEELDITRNEAVKTTVHYAGNKTASYVTRALFQMYKMQVYRIKSPQNDACWSAHSDVRGTVELNEKRENEC